MAIEDDPNLQALTKKQWETAESQISHAIAAVKKIGSDARKILDKVDEKDEMYVRMCLVSVHKPHRLVFHAEAKQTLIPKRPL